MKRQNLIKIHLYLSALFTPFLLLMAISGTCYLFGNKGSVHKETVRSITVGTNEFTKKDVISHVKSIDPNYSYEYIKGKPGIFYTRPTTRMHYIFKQSNDGSFKVYKATPNLLASIIEVHKGHGPKLVKTLEKILGFILMLILTSGVWLALQLKRDRLVTIVLMGTGFSILTAMILLL